jgi:Domain of unknown function (DUF5122) beta-propeller
MLPLGGGWRSGAGEVRWGASHRMPGGIEPAQASRSIGPAVYSRPSSGVPAGNFAADPNLWGANGNVATMARAGNTLYIGGSFRSVGENIGGFVPIDMQSAEPRRPFPKVAGFVYAIVPDGSGGWYLGGEFTAIGGIARSCLAQIRADGSVTDWNPSVTGSPGYIDPPAVLAIAVQGNQMFVGGAFREIGGRPHENLGCVDVRTGAVLNWNLDTNVEGWVPALAVHDDQVFVGGGFSSVGGVPRSSLAAVSAATGEVLPWHIDIYGESRALLVRDDTLYVAGNFIGIAGVEQHMLAAVDINTAALLPFNPRAAGIVGFYIPAPYVAALAMVGDTLYAGGNFTDIGGRSQPSLAALNPTTGDALPWVPAPVGPLYPGFSPRAVRSLAVHGGRLYIGGSFSTVGGVSHPYVCELDRLSGAVTPWDPKPDLPVYALGIQGHTVLIGGDFSVVGGWQHRAGLAAIDLSTGTLKPWNPNPNGVVVTALAVHDDRVFVSGDFSIIGGDPQPRQYLAALDTINGEVTDWNPGANDIANTFLLSGDTLYVGGEFSQLGGEPRKYLGALNTNTGEALPWNPNPNWSVFSLARGGNTMYVGGLFTQMSNQSRRGIAAVNATTGALESWNLDTDYGFVEAILISGNTVYVGGEFGQIGGQPRRSIAALDLSTGAATPWYPQPTAWGSPTEVKALGLVNGELYVGGSFGSIGGKPRICLAAVDTSTGLATDWDPGLDGLVWSLASNGNTVYVGGGFTRAGGLPAVGLAAFSPPVEPPVPEAPAAFALSQSIPNPARSSAIIRFTLSAAAAVTLSVYDLQGRRVATLLDHDVQPAGRHDVPFQFGALKPGMYLYRLEAGGRAASRKMLIVR